MRKYNVEIEETLTKIIEVEAESEWDAMVQIENKYTLHRSHCDCYIVSLWHLLTKATSYLTLLQVVAQQVLQRTY